MDNNEFEMNVGTEASRPIIINKRSGCLGDGLKIGCGFIAGAFFMLILMGAFFYFGPSQDMDKVYNDFEDYAEEQQDIRTFNVRSKKGKATIHTGMPKDSVLLLLGEPTEFMSNDIMDNISYRYGNYDLNVLKIEFENGKVKSVSQH